MNFKSNVRKIAITSSKLLLSLILLFSYFPNSSAKVRSFSMELNDVSISYFLDYVENRSEYVFFYQQGCFDPNSKITVEVKNASITSTLDKAFNGLNLNYLIKERQIILQKLVPSTQQEVTNRVVGAVVDIDGEPIIGANVKIKGSGTGVITDLDGKFQLNCNRNSILLISFVGYKPQEIKVTKKKYYKIVLKENSELLDEVVISAFGTGQKKESVVGSIQTVAPKDLKIPSSNLSTAFAGRMAGVVAYQRSGMPGSNGANFYIRGISTISGVTSPLIILDGVEISSGDLNSIDPEIIEGFSILKDATATAMYGTRGANGVMIIKTKSGENSDKPIIGVRVEANVTMPTKIPKFVNGDRYMELWNEAITNQGTGDLLYTAEDIINTKNAVNKYIYPNIDWYDEIFNNYAFNQKANFNIRGGTRKITYFMNLTANHETGMLKNRSRDFFSYKNNIELMNYAFQNNIDFHMSKSSTISLHLNAQIKDMSAPAESVNDIYNSIMATNPVDFPVYYPNTGEKWVKWGAYAGGNDQGAKNPLAYFTNGYKESFASTVIANVDFDQKLDFITKGLRFKALVSFKNWTYTETKRSQGRNRYSLESKKKNDDGTYEYEIKPLSTPSKPVLETSRTVNGDRRIYFQSYVDYNRNFGDHYVGGMVLVNLDEYSQNAGNDLIASLPKRKIGYAFRASYDYAHRYMVELNAGYNGSENFAKGHRFGFFPSFALGWNVAQEPFFKSLTNIISNLKLRGSYGLVGNDQIGGERFIYMSDITLQKDKLSYTTGYGNNSVSLKGPSYNRFENKEITWEVGEKLNIGFDMQLFHELNLTFDAFREIRRDIFQQKGSIPNYLGTADSKIFGNLAKVKNWGFDLSVDYGKQINKDLSIQFKGTFTYAKNKVLEYDEAPGVRPANSRIGFPVNRLTGYVTDRLYIDQADIDNSAQSTLGNIAIAPGDIKYLDQPNKNGEFDGKITGDDVVAMGYPTVPEIVYGFGPSVSYKKWDFSFFFQGVANTSMMMGNFYPFGTQYNRNVLKFIADDYWSASNQNINAKYPRLTKFNNDHNNKNSDYWLRSGNFMKLKNAEIGYSYKNARIYVNGMNLLTFAPFDLWDPEMGGGAALKYPTQRTFNIGIQLRFN